MAEGRWEYPLATERRDGDGERRVSDNAERRRNGESVAERGGWVMDGLHHADRHPAAVRCRKSAEICSLYSCRRKRPMR